MCCGKGGVLCAGGLDGLDAGAIRVIGPPTPRVVDLRHQAQVRQGRGGSSAKRRLGKAGQERLKRMHPFGDEMGHPVGARRLLAAGGVPHNGQVAHRMQVHGDDMGQGLNAGAQQRVAREQTQTARRIKILKDREGLGQSLPVYVKHGHKPLGIARQMGVRAVVFGQQIHGLDPVGDPCKVQRDAHAVTGGGLGVIPQHDLTHGGPP